MAWYNGKHHVDQNSKGADNPSTMESNTGTIRSAADAAKHVARHRRDEPGDMGGKSIAKSHRK